MGVISKTDPDKDEIAFEDWLRKGVKPEHKLSFSVSVRKSQQTFQEQFKHEDVIQDRKIYKMVEDFCKGRDIAESHQLKELNFIMKSGLNRDIARNIDFKMREKLEKIFPQLEGFNVICFNRKGYSTLRKAHVYQSDEGYSHFMEVLGDLAKKHNGKLKKELQSKVKMSFKGKYVIQIEEHTYKNFMEEIKAVISHNGLPSSVKQLIKKREISLFGTDEKMGAMRNCVKEIMSLLQTTTMKLDPDCYKFESYALKCEAGEEIRSRSNNKFSGKASCSYDPSTNELTFKGTEKSRQAMKNFIEST